MLWVLLGGYGYKAAAQPDDKWVFGYHAGIDFSGVTPVAFTSAIEGFGEGNASVADASGQLLFYTEGSLVWTRGNTLMPNGSDLTGLTSVTSFTVTSSSSQGVLIIPMPGNANRYYIFSLTSMEQNSIGNAGKLYYSVVDMTLNGGLGDVVPGMKGVLVDSDLSERMTAVVGDRCNIWVIACSVNAEIKSYEVNFSGVSATPVTSTVGIPQLFTGKLCASPNGQKLAATKCGVFGQGLGGAMLFDFDKSTGLASNPINLLDNAGGYGVCFSPDNSKLYVSAGFQDLYQYNVALGSAAAIRASETRIGVSSMTDIKQASNGKLYFKAADYLSGSTNYLASINAPNLAGTACQYTTNAIALAAGTSVISGLTNIVPNFHFSQDTLHSHAHLHDECFRERVMLQATNSNGWTYTWNNGATGPQQEVTTPGTYIVGYYTSPCSYNQDSFEVTFPVIPVVNSCADTYNGMAWVIPAAGDTTTYSYTWTDSASNVLSTDDTLRQVGAGTYLVLISSPGGCHAKLEVKINEDVYPASFLADTLVCTGTVQQYQNTSDPYFTGFQWSFGDGQTTTVQHPSHSYIQAGNYEVMLVATGVRCSDTAYSHVTADAPVAIDIISDRDTICTGMAVDFTIQPGADSSLKYYGWSLGDSTTVSPATGQVRHAYASAGVKTVQVSAVFRVCPEVEATQQIYVAPLPKVYLGPDSSMCLGGKAIVVSDQHQQPPGSRYLWNTGATAKSIEVRHPGTYSLAVTGPEGCTNSELIHVLKDCYIDIPNAFTPNGDDVNDYFFPRQLLSSSLNRFSMKVFNRWGQIVFETNNTNGRGWDGRFNGKDQPQGVYLYLIDVEIAPDHKEQYKGNVTLIR